jgi:CRISPR system Cascade subunit CasE
VERGADSGFLFRIDPQLGGRAMIVVQSATKPDWDYAFQNAGHLLVNSFAAPPQVKELDPCFSAGQQLRFRIRVNLSKKIKTSTAGIDLTRPRVGTDPQGRPKAQSKRVALTWDKDQDPQDAIREWFAKKAQNGGFKLGALRALHIGWGAGNDPDSTPAVQDSRSGDRRMKFRSALLEGTLTVEDPAKFREAVVHGIGPGKAFGFGLLSVAPEARSAGGDV